MNTKRQTIWLVTMLSIMVVLSAYYLLSENLNDMDFATDALNEQDGDHILIDSTQDWSDDIWSELEEHAHHSHEDSSLTPTEEEILKQVEAQQTSGYEFFTSLYLEREEAFAEETEQLLSIINNANGDIESTAQAWNEYYELEEKSTKLTYIEDQLRKDYENAIVVEEEDKWKVIVQADEMEKSEAVSIIDLVMSELDVDHSQVVVQFRK